MVAAMKIDELVATTMPKRIGVAKFSTALPPQIAIGAMQRNVASEV
jgi:hypothetical protein